MSFAQDFEEQHGYPPMGEDSMSSAIKLFFMYGISPGSCTSAIIRGDYEDAYARAHTHLKMIEDKYSKHAGLKPIKCLYDTFRFFLGETVCDYDNWPGINNIPDYEQAMIFLESPHLSHWIKEAANAECIR